MIPDYLAHPIVARAKALASKIGDVRTVTEVVDAFKRIGVAAKLLESVVGCPISPGKLTEEAIGKLRGLYASIQRGDTTVQELWAGLGADAPDAPDALPSFQCADDGILEGATGNGGGEAAEVCYSTGIAQLRNKNPHL